MGSLAAPLLCPGDGAMCCIQLYLMEPREAGSPPSMAQYHPFILHCCPPPLTLPTLPIPLVIYSLLDG